MCPTGDGVPCHNQLAQIKYTNIQPIQFKKWKTSHLIKSKEQN